MMTNEVKNLQLLSFNIILHAGNARSNAMEAINMAKKYNFKAAREMIELADSEFIKAHEVQTELLKKEASGKKHEIPIILIHAQDHLMTALMMKDTANEMIDMYERIESLEEKKQ